MVLFLEDVETTSKNTQVFEALAAGRARDGSDELLALRPQARSLKEALTAKIKFSMKHRCETESNLSVKRRTS